MAAAVAAESVPAAALRARAGFLGGYLGGEGGGKPRMLVLCGAQGAGKSWFCAELLRGGDGGGAASWAQISQDVLGRCEIAVYL